MKKDDNISSKAWPLLMSGGTAAAELFPFAKALITGKGLAAFAIAAHSPLLLVGFAAAFAAGVFFALPRTNSPLNHFLSGGMGALVPFFLSKIPNPFIFYPLYLAATVGLTYLGNASYAKASIREKRMAHRPKRARISSPKSHLSK